MPNNCFNHVRLSGKESTIALLAASEFSFDVLCPVSESQSDSREQQERSWGTKWNRSDYNVVNKGKNVLDLEFVTAWTSPYLMYKHLLRTYPDLWLMCEWKEEGGYAGVFVGYTKPDEGLVTKDLKWEDWSLEEHYYLFKEQL